MYLSFHVKLVHKLSILINDDFSTPTIKNEHSYIITIFY